MSQIGARRGNPGSTTTELKGEASQLWNGDCLENITGRVHDSDAGFKPCEHNSHLTIDDSMRGRLPGTKLANTQPAN
jgi:hypothetical protein